MELSEIRDYADRLIVLPFRAQIEVDLPGDLLVTSVGRGLAMQAIDADIELFCAQVAREFADARRFFGAFAIAAAETHSSLPWLPRRIGEIDPSALTLLLQQISSRFDFHQPLAGQRFEGYVEVASFPTSGYRQQPARPIVFMIEAVELEDGSIRSKIRGTLGITVTTLTLACGALATPPGQDIYYDWMHSRTIERAIRDQPCKTEASWKIDLTSLRREGMESLNYEEPGLSHEERFLRTCNVQLALALAQGSPQLIDGKAGSKTRDALALYSKQKGLSPHVQDERLRGYLLEELQRHRR
jgi:hypothetical protein